MVIQIVEGIILANVNLGSNNARQAVATVHLSVGALTWASLTAAGALMIGQ